MSKIKNIIGKFNTINENSEVLNESTDAYAVRQDIIGILKKANVDKNVIDEVEKKIVTEYARALRETQKLDTLKQIESLQYFINTYNPKA